MRSSPDLSIFILSVAAISFGCSSSDSGSGSPQLPNGSDAGAGQGGTAGAGGNAAGGNAAGGNGGSGSSSTGGQSGTAGNATGGQGGAAGSAQSLPLGIPSIQADHGIFDASLAQDPGSSRIWMSYSTINTSQMWPVQSPHAVANRLAYTDNQGGTWTDFGAVTATTDVDLVFLTQPPFNLSQDFRAGTWQSEVSSLVFDAGATTPEERWKLLFMHYLIINGARHFEHYWMGLKMAATPETLGAATEIKLFTGAGYEPANDVGGGPTAVPVDGPASFALDTAIAQLNGCVFSEPGLLSTGSDLVLSLLCAKPAGPDRSIVIIKCASPCDIGTVGGAHGWAFVGTALTEADSDSFGFDQGFSAPNLVGSKGQYYLIATPVRSTPFDGFYGGCKVFPFTDLGTATLARTNGVPAATVAIDYASDDFGGACTYWPGADKAGIIRSQLFPSSPPEFRLFSTGINF